MCAVSALSMVGSLGFCGQRISAYFTCGNAEIKHHFCRLQISVAFLRNADISAKLILVAKKSQICCSFRQNIVQHTYHKDLKTSHNSNGHVQNGKKVVYVVFLCEVGRLLLILTLFSPGEKKVIFYRGGGVFRPLIIFKIIIAMTMKLALCNN